MAGGHIGDETLARFFARSLPEDEAGRVRTHIDVCADCRQLFAELGASDSAGPETTADGPPTEAAPDRDPYAPGAVLDGRYRIDRMIGHGGMGTVLAATHLELRHQVAIKLLHEEVAHEAEAVARFLREGRAAASLTSDHALRIHDVGRLSSGARFLVMEYLEGENLELRCARQTPSVDIAVRWILEACEALGEAHANGLVHRDVKPQNLFLAKRADGRERVKVLDFGIAKDLRRVKATSFVTGDSLMIGTPHYMSPEQIRDSSDVDARTDIWAIGATLYRLLAGHPPFASPNVAESLRRILTDPTPDVRVARPEVPLHVEAAIRRCLDKDRALRFTSVGDLVTALRNEALPSTRPQKVPVTVPMSTVEDPPRVGTEPLATRISPAVAPVVAPVRLPPAFAETQLSPPLERPASEPDVDVDIDDVLPRPSGARRALVWASFLCLLVGGASFVALAIRRMHRPVAEPPVPSIVAVTTSAPASSSATTTTTLEPTTPTASASETLAATAEPTKPAPSAKSKPPPHAKTSTRNGAPGASGNPYDW